MIATPVELAKWQRVCAAVAVVGAAIGIVGVVQNPEQFFRSYLFAFMFWFGMGVGCLGLLMLLHVAGGAWSDLIRPLLEAGCLTIPWLAVMFVPLLFGLSYLYPWSNAATVAGDAVLRHRHVYLNVPFFIARALMCFGVWSIMAIRLNHWSNPANGTTEARARRHSAPGLLIYFVTLMFCLVDWTMSLEPHWTSTVYETMIIVGQALGALALAVCGLAIFGQEDRVLGGVPPKPFIDLGNMVMVFVMFWAYTAFSQYLIIWSGDIPDEIAWYLHRQQGGWFWIAMALIVFQFFVPFAVLLGRSSKARLKSLAWICVVVLGARFVDVYWTIEPAFFPTEFHVHWLDAALPLALGSVWFAAVFGALKKRAAVIGTYIEEKTS